MKLTHVFETRLPGTFIGAVCSLVLAAPASAQNYTAFDIGSLGTGATYATAINASGQVTGNSVTKDGPYHAFVTQANGADMADLGTLPGGFNSYGFAINDKGQVTGKSDYANPPTIGGPPTFPHAFVSNPNGTMNLVTSWSFSEGHGINNSAQIAGFEPSGGVFVTGVNGLDPRRIGNLNSYTDEAYDINSSGQVVGSAHISSSSYKHAFISSSNHVYASDLGTLGGFTSSATGVNDAGKVVGYSETTPVYSSPIHAFITDINSNMTDLGTFGGQSSAATDINSNGQVVGWAETGIGNQRHAFVTGLNGAGMTDLNSLVHLGNGTFLYDANGINDRGQIIANASDGHSYLLTLTTPVPEPDTYAMLLAGLGLMGFIARRKKVA
jgi:probable HAF family extracellular repeat protein